MSAQSGTTTSRWIVCPVCNGEGATPGDTERVRAIRAGAGYCLRCAGIGGWWQFTSSIT